MLKVKPPPAPKGSQYRRLNPLQVASNDIELTKIPSPAPLVRSPPIRNYFHYKVQYQIHETFVRSEYSREFANRDYAVTDDTKIVGYLINGYFFNFKHLY